MTKETDKKEEDDEEAIHINIGSVLKILREMKHNADIAEQVKIDSMPKK